MVTVVVEIEDGWVLRAKCHGRELWTIQEIPPVLTVGDLHQMVNLLDSFAEWAKVIAFRAATTAPS